MSFAGQRVQPRRYTVIPRTLTFLTHAGDVLLIRIPTGRGAWAGHYNGIGGHIEHGEDPLTSARREVMEETVIVPQGLRLCGVVMVDTGSQPGIGLYVFAGEGDHGTPKAGSEGTAEWLGIDALDRIPLVEDLPILLPKVLESRPGSAPFSAAYRYDADGQLRIEFAE